MTITGNECYDTTYCQEHSPKRKKINKIHVYYCVCSKYFADMIKAIIPITKNVNKKYTSPIITSYSFLNV